MPRMTGNILIFCSFMRDRRDADGLRCSAVSDAVKKRFVVHALDDEDWSPRFLVNRCLDAIGYFCLAMLSNLNLIGRLSCVTLFVIPPAVGAFHLAGDAAGNAVKS